MVGFTLAGAAATAFSLRLTWIPLLAPVIVAAIVIVVAAPLVVGGVSAPAPAPAADNDPPGGYE
jgi:flagellar basal body-associated protein FliL